MKIPEQTEDERVRALTLDIVVVHINRLQAVIARFRIGHARQMFNLDESGCASGQMDVNQKGMH